MELVELPKAEEKNELNDFQKENLFESIVRGKDVIEKIKTSRGEFEVKFPRSRDLQAIGLLTAYKLSGIAEKCFDSGSYSLIQEIATLDVIVRSGPAWYENAKKENDNFSWGDIPSQKFIEEAYAKALAFRFKVQAMLDNEPDTGDKAVASAESADVSSGTGVFSGISSGDGK